MTSANIISHIFAHNNGTRSQSNLRMNNGVRRDGRVLKSDQTTNGIR